MHRDEELRTHQIMHQLNFLLAGMAGNMDPIALFVNDIRSQLVKMVNGTGNQLFVAGNGRSRDNDGIAGHNVHLFVVVHRHTSQRAHGLALTTGGNNYNLVRSIVMSFINIDNLALRSLQIAQLLGDVHYIHHAAADDCHLAVIFQSRVNHLLNTVNVGGEGCHDNAVFRIAELIVKGLTHHFFAGSKAGALRIGAVG